MGCDIHLFVEKQLKSGKWVRVSDKLAPMHPYYKSDASQEHKDFFGHTEWDTGRNYILFGLLAGVRRHQIAPIAEPKGVPDDLSAEVAKEWKSWQSDGHTPSWFTAKELLEAKDKPIKCRSCVSMKTYREYLKSGKQLIPSNEFPWERPQNLVTNDEMERYIALSAFWDGTEYATDILWDDPNISRDNFKHLFEVLLPAMLKIQPDPEKIRIVFWFDN